MAAARLIRFAPGKGRDCAAVIIGGKRAGGNRIKCGDGKEIPFFKRKQLFFKNNSGKYLRLPYPVDSGLLLAHHQPLIKGLTRATTGTIHDK
jgi:hypothetical protein